MIGTVSFRSMGCEVVVGGSAPRDISLIQTLFAARDAIFSRFRPDSELNSVNAASGRVVRVSEEFARAVGTALKTAERTDGLVDPTLGRSIEDAGYTEDFSALEPDSEPAGPGGRGCWKSVRLSGRLLRVPAGVLLDLNCVVKAMTVDHALALLSGPGFVSAGGDLAVNTEVDVGLPGGDAVRVLRGGLATSGTSERHWLRAGVPQHHLIDPRTGRSAESPWEQVSASGASCLDADAAAKAAFFLGDDGPDWLDEHGIPGRFLTDDGAVVTNASWRAALEEVVASI